MLWGYRIFIWVYGFAIRLAAPFNKKAKLWANGRHGVFDRIKTEIDPSRPLVWMHCASLGEFEQGLPILEASKQTYPDHVIMVTFFSPSGYEIRKNHTLPDHVFYLPEDTAGNAEKFLALTKPKLAIFVRYELWYYYLSTLSGNGTPVILLSAIFQANKVFFKSWGGFFRKMLGFFDMIFVQDEFSKSLLEKIDLQKVKVTGDTRVDRVIKIADTPYEDKLIASFSANHKIFIAGSTWPKDEAILVPFINELYQKRWKTIIAPHNIDHGLIEKLRLSLPDETILYSDDNPEKANAAQVIIIDNIGKLSKLYRFGDLVYIGGGFGVSVHNILEAMVYNIPVIFGPNHKHIREAVEMSKNKACIPVNGNKELENAFDYLTKEQNYTASKERIATYISNNSGATEEVMAYLKESLDA
ncbi:MAG: glycosyltransferase N-terminal domain-containing protein [Bacteroidota bacterium]